MLAFAVLAPVSLVGLPFAALLVAARPGTRREWVAAALAGGVSAALLLTPEAGLLDALTRAWIVLVTVAFGASAAVRPAGFWPLALRACLYAAAGVAVLGPLVAGPAVWDEVQWDATRAASGAVRGLVQLAPPVYPVFEPAVRVLAGGWPVWLLLETVVGLALAWHGHALVARTPLTASRARRDQPASSGATATSPDVILNH